MELNWRSLETRLVVALSALFSIILVSCNSNQSATNQLTIILDPGAKSFTIDTDLIHQFEKQTGQQVTILKAAVNSTERLSQYLQYLGAESPDIDVYQVDVIWPSTLENHLLDLKDPMSTETASFLPALIRNNTVHGKLLAMPWYLDLPLLYYRGDLLQKYRYANPPATWDELTSMALAIQNSERASGSPNIWGYVWQGRAYEGLTCNALEWQVSEGGGKIISDTGQIEVNNPDALTAFNRAASWVGTISPPGVTMYAEEEARQMFQGGNAVFMRNWPYAYSLVDGDQSPVAGKVKTAPLPAGAHGSAATLGGWHLAVSRYSTRPRAAVELVRFLTSSKSQKREALDASRLPTRTSLYDDTEIAAKYPFMPTMRDALDTAVARPSSSAGADYNEVSTYYYVAVHEILTGQKTADESMADLDKLLHKVLDK